MPDSKFFMPDIETPYIAVVMLVSTLIYLDFMPNTTSPILQWLLQLCGQDIVHWIVQGVVVIHVFEALFAIYLTAVVGRGFFEPIHVAQWSLGILVFGYPFLSSLIPLAKRQQQLLAGKKQ